MSKLQAEIYAYFKYAVTYLFRAVFEARATHLRLRIK